MVHLNNHCILWPSTDKYTEFPDTVKLCTPVYESFRDIRDLVMLVTFLAALTANTITNVRIVHALKRQPPRRDGNQVNQRNDQIKRRLTWMVLVNSLVFFVCLAPTYFQTIRLLIMKYLNITNKHEDKKFIHTAYILIMVNSAVNPILYGVASPSYRRGFLKAFGLKTNKIAPTKDNNNTTNDT